APRGTGATGRNLPDGKRYRDFPRFHRIPDMLQASCSICRITLTGISRGRILVRRTNGQPAPVPTEVDPMPEPVETPAAALMRLTNGYQVSQAIHVAAELRLADFIGGEPGNADEIAPRVGAHAGSLYRLLRALSTVGIFREIDDKRFVGSPVSDLLRTDHPRSMCGWT